MVVATGFFDGVHLGHRLVLSQLVAAAKERGDESMVITFWPHPRTVLQSGARDLRLLTSLEEKKSLLKELGVDHVEVLPFTKEFSAMTAREYLRDCIKGRFGGKAILVGYDNRLGGDVQTPDSIEALAREEGLDVIRTESISCGSGIISSTKVREMLSAGNVEAAAEMLGYRYSLLGVVVAGDRIGRTIGFPTANMQLYEPLKLIPANGVYEVEVETLGKSFRGMCNIGVRPTVSSRGGRTVETNIFGFDEDIYGLDIRITFVRRIREERCFSSIGQLQAQLSCDRNSILSGMEK